jgi:hypothetical protein
MGAPCVRPTVNRPSVHLLLDHHRTDPREVREEAMTRVTVGEENAVPINLYYEDHGVGWCSNPAPG